MDKSLLIVVIFLGVFSVLKVIMFIAYSFIMKPKVDENGRIVKQEVVREGDASQTQDDMFWDDW